MTRDPAVTGRWLALRVGMRHVWWAWAVAACGPEPDAGWDCARPGSVCTVAGTGAHGFNGDGKPAERTWLYFPTAVRFLPDGTPLVVDYNNLRVRALDADGVVRTLAGDGRHDDARAGPAVHSPLENPIDAWPVADGGFLVAELHAGRVLEVGPGGTLWVVAGTARLGDSGDGGPALDARFSELAGIAATGDGRVFVADTDNHRIRVVDLDAGTVDAAAGSGERGLADGPAADARFDGPRQMAWHDGALYVADTGNHAVRRYDPASGEVRTVAGRGEPGHAGDGGPAVDALLRDPHGVAVAPDGTLWIADSGNHVVRRVDPDGTIHTAVGLPGAPGDGPDAGDAADCALNLPNGVSVAPDGAVWIADTLNSKVRVLVP